MPVEVAPGVTVSDATLTQIVVQAAESVGGARVRRPRRGLERRGLEVQGEEGRARVEVELAAQYGSVLPELGRAVQERVAGALRTMCGLDPAAVDVAIEEFE
jgi:uncharacterized alkaline shock family protein YloU